MTLTLEIPDAFTRPLRLDGEHGRRRALEMLALEGYREGSLSRGQVSEMLGWSFFETEEFLHEHDALPADDAAGLLRSGEALRSLLGRS